MNKEKGKWPLSLVLLVVLLVPFHPVRGEEGPKAPEDAGYKLSDVMVPAFKADLTQKLMSSEEAERTANRHYYWDDAGHSINACADLMIRNPKGQIRHHWHFRCREEFYGKNNVEFKQYIYMFRPPDLERLQIIMVTYVPWMRKEKDIWMYLPELRKIRRVPQADGDDAFMGTDRTWDGLPRERPAWRDHWRHIKDDVCRGHPVHVREARIKIGKGLDKKTYRYPVRMCFVGKEHLLNYREEQYDRKGRLAIVTDRPWDNRNPYGIWRPEIYVMTNVQTGSQSMTDCGSRIFNYKIPDEHFSPSMLGKIRSIKEFTSMEPSREVWDSTTRDICETLPEFPKWYYGKHYPWEWEKSW